MPDDEEKIIIENKNSVSPEDVSSESQYGMGMQALVKSLRVAFFVLALAIVGMIVYFFTFGGYFTVNPQEEVLVLRFGKLVGKYKKGWHWIFPYPINRIIKVPKNQQTLESQTFMPKKTRKEQAALGERRNEKLVPGRDGYVITGDENIMHVSWVLNYRIVDAERYYLNYRVPEDPRTEDEIFVNPETKEVMGARGPRTLLKSELDSAILKIAALQKVDTLYKNSADFTNAVNRYFKKRMVCLNTGITVDNLLIKSSPPERTNAAFNRVLEAEQESATMREDARKYEIEQENLAEAEAAQVIADAEAYRKRIVSEVEADEKYFNEILEQYRKNPETVLFALYNNVLAEALAQVKNKFMLNRKMSGKQEVRLKINPEPLEPPKKKVKK